MATGVTKPRSSTALPLGAGGAPEWARDTVSKVSVSLPDSVTNAVREVAGPGQFSAYVAAALARQIRLDQLAAYVAEVEAELGRPISDALMAEAAAAWHAGIVDGLTADDSVDLELAPLDLQLPAAEL